MNGALKALNEKNFKNEGGRGRPRILQKGEKYYEKWGLEFPSDELGKEPNYNYGCTYEEQIKRRKSRMKLDTIKLSFSALKAFAKSPAHFSYYKKRAFKGSAAMRRGKLTHELVLEPEKEILVIDVATRANKQFKEAVEQYGEDGVFTRKEYNEAKNLAAAVMNHPLANKLINEATSKEEHIHFSLDGVKFHGYADIIGHDYIADLKITDNEPKKLQRWVLDNLYHMQLALYSHGVFNSEARIKHYLITCDPNAPYGVIVYELSAEVMEDGFNRARLEVSMFKDWYRGWDGESTPKSYDYSEPLNSAMTLELPTWYR